MKVFASKRLLRLHISTQMVLVITLSLSFYMFTQVAVTVRLVQDTLYRQTLKENRIVALSSALAIRHSLDELKPWFEIALDPQALNRNYLDESLVPEISVFDEAGEWLWGRGQRTRFSPLEVDQLRREALLTNLMDESSIWFVRKQGERWVAIRLTIAYFEHVLAHQTLGLEYYLNVMDGNGAPIVHSQRHRFAPLGNETLVMEEYIPQTSWQVRVTVPENTVNLILQPILIPLITLLLITTLVTLILVQVLTYQITTPLRKLTHAAALIEMGNYNERIQLESSLEISMLARTLDNMRQEIARRDIELRNANAELAAHSAAREELSRSVLVSKEEEQKRIARELHDGIGQTLAALKITLDLAQKSDDLAKNHSLMGHASQMAEQLMEEVHQISQDLRPTILDDLGLSAAMIWQMNQLSKLLSLNIRHNLRADAVLDLSPEALITAYRFFQEALNNIQKHSQSQQVEVQMNSQGSYLIIMVKDDGVGFENAETQSSGGRLSLGLRNLRERLTLVGGELVTHSQKGEGTTLIAILPFASGIIEENKEV